jgi:hypothetical protein
LSLKLKYVKSGFYDAAGTRADGRTVHNVFSTQDEAWHTEEIRPIKKCYSLPNIVKYEPAIDRALDKFIETLQDRFVSRNDAVCDLAEWLKYCQCTIDPKEPIAEASA